MWKKIATKTAGTYWSNNVDKECTYKLFDPVSDIPLLNINDPEIEYSLTASGVLLRTETIGTAEVKLPSGVYCTAEIDHAVVLKEHSIPDEEQLLDLDVTSKIIDDFNRFLESKDFYQNLKLSYKRGILLYGPPGTGKSCLINKIIQKIKNDGKIIIFVKTYMPSYVIDGLRDQDELKILIFEEFTNHMNSNGTASEAVLSLLDGDCSISNTFVIASTNYPEKLPINIVNRPGRFDKFYYLGGLSESDIKKYTAKFDIVLTDTDLKLLKNVTIALLKEVILRSELNKTSMSDTLKEIVEQSKFIRESSIKDDNLGNYIL